MPKNYVRVHNQKDTHDNWSSFNPILLDGEIIIVSFSGSIRFKVGDGVTHYNNLPFLDENITGSIDKDALKEIESKINEIVNDKLDKTTTLDNVGKILSVDSKGNLVFVQLDMSGQNQSVTVSSVIGLTELLNKKADDSTVDKLSEQVSELSNKLDNLNLELPPIEVSINDIVGLAEVLRGKADDSEVKELSEIVDSMNERLSEMESDLSNKLPTTMPITDAGKVLCIDEQGNIVPKEIEFSEGGSGGIGGGGVITWGDLINKQ